MLTTQNIPEYVKKSVLEDVLNIGKLASNITDAVSQIITGNDIMPAVNHIAGRKDIQDTVKGIILAPLIAGLDYLNQSTPQGADVIFISEIMRIPNKRLLLKDELNSWENELDASRWDSGPINTKVAISVFRTYPKLWNIFSLQEMCDLVRSSYFDEIVRTEISKLYPTQAQTV